MEEALARGVQIFLALSGAYLIALWFALAVWAYRDIGARSQSVVTQIFATLLVVVFSIPGALLYLLLRPKDTLDEAYQRSLEEEYLLQDLGDAALCHSCQRPVEEEFILCPHCQAMLKEACPACARLINVKWAICPYCGTSQSDRAAAVHEQLPPPAERFIERGAGTFRPLPSSSIREFEPLPFSEPDYLEQGYEAPELESGYEDFEPPEIDEPEPIEPIRLFDRRRTRMLRSAESDSQPVTLNGTVNGVAEREEPEAADDLHQASNVAPNGSTDTKPVRAEQQTTSEEQPEHEAASSERA